MMIPAYNYEAQKEMTVDEYEQMCDTVADVQVCSTIIDADKSNAELEAKLDSWERSLERDQEASRLMANLTKTARKCLNHNKHEALFQPSIY